MDMINTHVDEDGLPDVDNIHCGVGSCRPVFAQRLKNMACFTATYSLTGIVTSALNIYINSQITTLEKHFNFSSSVSGFLMSCNDFGYLTTTLIMSYYTRRAHVPRALAFSTILYGLSGLFCTIAFFGSRGQIPSPPKDSDDVNNASHVVFAQTCQNTTSSHNASCQDISSRAIASFHVSDSWRTISICIIAAGMFLQWVAKSPRQPFLGTYVDDNVPKTKTSLYLGTMVGLSFFGPAVAFALGGIFSSFYVTLEETNMTPRDPRWLGAWWLGFLIFGGAGLVVAVPLICFPKRMRRQPEQSAIKKRQKERKGKIPFWRDFRDFLRSILRLCFNPIYICLVVASGVNLMGISGMMAFIPKYMETQFTITASQANIMLGAINIMTASIGTIIGGCLTSRLKLSPLSCLKLLNVSIVISTLLMVTSFFTACHKSGDSTVSLCVQDCNCDTENFFPVCGSDNRNYFSPCHAGCSSMDQSGFTNCSCLATNATQTARGGLCVPDCHTLYIYIALSLCGAFVSTFVIMPGFIVTIRSVKEEDKPLAIGFAAFSGTLIGWFPGPVIFGTLVDTTCLVWRSTCSSVGACSLYDIELFRFRIHFLVVGLRFITLSLYLSALAIAIFAKKPIFQPQDNDVSADDKHNHHDNEVEITGAEAALILQSNPAVRETAESSSRVMPHGVADRFPSQPSLLRTTKELKIPRVEGLQNLHI